MYRQAMVGAWSHPVEQGCSSVRSRSESIWSQPQMPSACILSCPPVSYGRCRTWTVTPKGKKFPPADWAASKQNSKGYFHQTLPKAILEWGWQLALYTERWWPTYVTQISVGSECTKELGHECKTTWKKKKGGGGGGGGYSLKITLDGRVNAAATRTRAQTPTRLSQPLHQLSEHAGPNGWKTTASVIQKYVFFFSPSMQVSVLQLRREVFRSNGANGKNIVSSSAPHIR